MTTFNVNKPNQQPEVDKVTSADQNKQPIEQAQADQTVVSTDQTERLTDNGQKKSIKTTDYQQVKSIVSVDQTDDGQKSNLQFNQTVQTIKSTTENHQTVEQTTESPETDSPSNRQRTTSTIILTNESSNELLEKCKKSGGWFSNVLFGCISPILYSIKFGKQHSQKPNDWIVPYKSIQNLAFVNAGSEGLVYRGELNGRTIAIKQVKTEKETQIDNLRKLRHNNVVRFIGICKDPYCILMEYCDINLTEYLKKRKTTIEPELIWEFAFQITSGMNYLHYNEIIHRDLKSMNILVCNENQLKICDFGYCKKIRNQDPERMSFCGTSPWIAPEVIVDEKCTEKVDVWSFGVLVWELLTCEIPYYGLDNAQIMYGVAHNHLALPISSDCPESFRLLIQMCLSRLPEVRPSFRRILLHLQVFCKECMIEMSVEKLNEIKANWRKEIESAFSFLNFEIGDVNQTENNELKCQRKQLANTISLGTNVLNLYKNKLSQFNELYDEVTSLCESLKARQLELDRLLEV